MFKEELLCSLSYSLGMADYQVLPPGLNSMGVSVDPKDFQMNGVYIIM